ncbi:MAG TPA: rod shape-determining protein MreD [Steroidobacteraceae bacterium]|nr:rod shape-determining protein MreD [Steroidobacteraceae bacterium]
MSRGDHFARWPLFASGFAGLVLGLIPLPAWLDMLRPDFLALVVLYWAIHVPQAGRLWFAWCAGLLLDGFRGVVLGQFALAMTVIAAVAIYLHLRIRAYPIWHQAGVVFAALFLYHLTLWIVDGWSGHPVTTSARWIPAVTGALVWPFVSGILDKLHHRF